jgi:hypothetical protein
LVSVASHFVEIGEQAMKWQIEWGTEIVVSGIDFVGILIDVIEPWVEDFEPEDPCPGCGEYCHMHLCQQCDEVLAEHCTCDHPGRMDWCCSNHRAAFDL